MPRPYRLLAFPGLVFMAQPEARALEPAPPPTPDSKSPQTAASSPGRLVEYEAKARYLSILPDYIRWPAVEGGRERQLVVGVVGDSRFGDHLNALFAPESPQGRRNRLVYLTSRQAVETCDVLFICDSETDRLYEILRRIKGRPILTLADSMDFARRGVMINLMVERDRIAMEINLNVLRASGLEVSPHILKSAKIIE